MNPIALPFDLSDIVERCKLDATSEKREGNHLELAIGAARVRLICVPTPRPRADIGDELLELLERAAVDPFTVGAVATYGATFVVVPSKIALRFAERDPSSRSS